MTSKDNLEFILKEFTRHLSKLETELILDKAEPIVKDLEILEILKTIIKKSTIFNGIISIDDEINSVRATSFLTKIEYEKIREWLENEEE